MSTSRALLTARRGTVFLSLVSFVLSYIALADLARIAGLGPQAYLWPVMIDGAIVVGTVAVLASPDWHSWSMLVGAALVSVIGNGIHAWVTQGTWIAVGVALTPPVFLLWVTHLTVRLGRVESITQSDELPETIAEAEDRRERALRLVADGMSQRAVASVIGVSDTTIGKWRKAAAAVSQTNDTAPALKHSVGSV